MNLKLRSIDWDCANGNRDCLLLKQLKESSVNLAKDDVSSIKSCANNADCLDVEYKKGFESSCCSHEYCVDPNVCFNGRKSLDDYCHSGYECSSTCCIKNQCTYPYQCHQTCTKNSDCPSTQRDYDKGCCSEGYCSSLQICNGYKELGDYCDVSDECKSGYCSLNYRCI